MIELIFKPKTNEAFNSINLIPKCVLGSVSVECVSRQFVLKEIIKRLSSKNPFYLMLSIVDLKGGNYKKILSANYLCFVFTEYI